MFTTMVLSFKMTARCWTMSLIILTKKAMSKPDGQQDKGKLFYRSPDGSPVSGWFEDENGKYYLEKDGSPKIGWADIDKKKYYFQSNGAMATACMEIEGKQHFFHEDGSVSRLDGLRRKEILL